MLTYPAVMSGQIVTVNKAATGSYTTIANALNHFAVDPDTNAPNVIQITDTGVYEEIYNIEVPVTIECTASSATLAVLTNVNGTLGNGGIFINLPATITTGAVTLRNVNILPALSTKSPAPQNPPKELQTVIENGNNNVFLTLDNVVIAPNNGANQPIVTDGVTNKATQLIPTNAAYNPAIVQWGDDGIVLGRTTGRFEGAGVELLFKDSVISHLRFDLDASAFNPNTNCIWMVNEFGTNPAAFPSLFRRTRVEGKCGISFGWDGLNCAGDVSTHSDSDRIQVRGHAARGITFSGPAQNFRKISDVIFEGISQDGIIDDGYGSVRMELDNVILWSVVRSLFRIQKPTSDVAAGIVKVKDTTLVAARAGSNFHTIRFEVNTVTDAAFENAIVGGKINAATHSFNVISLAGDNQVSLSGTALITTGPYALRPSAPFSMGTSATVVGASTTGADPQFAGIQAGYLPSNPDFADVQAPEYATANSTGGSLGGGADYIGPTSGVSDWALYAEDTPAHEAERNRIIKMHDERRNFMGRFN